MSAKLVWKGKVEQMNGLGSVIGECIDRGFKPLIREVLKQMIRDGLFKTVAERKLTNQTRL